MFAARLVLIGCVPFGFLWAAGPGENLKPTPGDCPLFPVPKVWRALGETWTVDPQFAVISIPAQASEQQQYAAKRLQTHIQNRFKVDVPTVREDLLPATVKTVLRLETNKRPAGKFNGFTISFHAEVGRRVVTVRGQDDNGTIYGGDVLFDLMARAEDGTIGLTCIEVDDWPSIPYRGRPHFVLMQNLVPGALDAYVRARMNFTDVRDNPEFRVTQYYPDRAAPMGFPPGCGLDTANIGRMIQASHRRGLFVYACVAAATTQHGGGTTKGFDKLDESSFYTDVNETFKALVGLGCDGMWLSFDDIGKGTDPRSAIDNFLELGRTYRMSGRQLALTPPWGDYNKIDTPFNHEAGKIPGFNAIQWFFTRVPCPADAAMAKEIGLTLPPGWWHNLIGLRGGFTNNAKIAMTLRDGALELPGKGKVGYPLVHKADDRAVAGQAPTTIPGNPDYTWETYPCEIPLPAYIELQPMAAGWGAPTYDKIRDAARHTDCAMLWCVGGGWPEEYLVTMIGHWAWAPETHDWNRMRTAIYSYVYGPDMADTARTFDDQIVELKQRFELPVRICGPNKGWPCRLKDPAQRVEALDRIARLEALAETLAVEAPKGSAIDPKRLEYIYLEPMRAAVAYAKKMASCTYPEQIIPALEERIDQLLDTGTLDEARHAAAAAKAEGTALVATIEKQLPGLKIVDDYCAFWRERLASLDRAIALARLSPAERNRRFEEIVHAPATDTFPLIASSFAGILKAAWTPSAVAVGDTLVKEISADAWQVGTARCCGAFAAGTLVQAGPEGDDEKTFVGIGYPRRTPGRAGNYGRIRCSVGIPAEFTNSMNHKLSAQVFVSDTRLDGKYPGYRFAQLWVDGQKLWAAEVVPDQSGKEWVSLDLTESAHRALAGGQKELKLTFRVVDERAVSSFPTIVFVGPMRLIVKK